MSTHLSRSLDAPRFEPIAPAAFLWRAPLCKPKTGY